MVDIGCWEAFQLDSTGLLASNRGEARSNISPANRLTTRPTLVWLEVLKQEQEASLIHEASEFGAAPIKALRQRDSRSLLG